MTLKEKFKTKVSINTDGEAGRYAKECEKIADDYAIEFASWIQFHSELWIRYNRRELLQIFKKENGL